MKIMLRLLTLHPSAPSLTEEQIYSARERLARGSFETAQRNYRRAYEDWLVQCCDQERARQKRDSAYFALQTAMRDLKEELK